MIKHVFQMFNKYLQNSLVNAHLFYWVPTFKSKMMLYLVLIISIIVGISADPLPINDATSRIIGGADLASTMNSPFIAAVYHGGIGFLCAGVIVNSNWILTTAECVYAYSFEDPVQVYVEVGGVKLNTIESGKVQLTLSKIVIHPEFHSKEMIYYSNLALMKTGSAIPSNVQIAPIALPTTSAIVPGTSASLVGWGGSSNSYPVTTLQLSSLNVVLSYKECQRLSGRLLDRELCTDPTTSSSACKYDHGSPLYRIDAIYGTILIGLVNYAPCTTINYPTVYTSVPDYVNWIQTTLF